MELSIVIPIYRSTKHILLHANAIIDTLYAKYNSFEILLIIDNDEHIEEIDELNKLQRQYKEIRIHRLDKNYGQSFATLCGYHLAKGDYILSIDEDMVKYIPLICSNSEYRSFDVYYWFYDKDEMYTSGTRKIFSNLFKLLLHRLYSFHRNSTFRIIPKSFRDKILNKKYIFWNTDIIIFNNTKKVSGMQFTLNDVKDDESGYNYLKLIRLALETFYGQNIILMNFILALIPALFVLLASKKIATTLIAYIISNIILQILLFLSLKFTNKTIDKIIKALQPQLI